MGWTAWITRMSPKPVNPHPRFRVRGGKKYFFFAGGWREYSYQLWMQYVQNKYIKGVTIGQNRVRYMYYLGQWVLYNRSSWNKWVKLNMSDSNQVDSGYQTVVEKPQTVVSYQVVYQ